MRLILLAKSIFTDNEAKKTQNGDTKNHNAKVNETIKI